MLNIVVELWPFGKEAEKKVIGGLQIANDSTGTPWKGNYMYRMKPEDEWAPSVENYDRKNEVERLVYEVLKKKYGN